MLNQVRFEFVIELLSFTHVGDGGRDEAKDLVIEKDGKNSRPEYLTIQRGVNDEPVVEAASIRGAIRAHLRNRGLNGLVRELFGAEDVETAIDSAGKLRLHAGRLDVAVFGIMLPAWKKERYTFILPGLRLDADRAAVEEKLLYHTEFLPDGCRFRFSGTFLGTEQEFKNRVADMFAALATEAGFEIGGQTGYGTGRARLVSDSVRYEARHYDIWEKKFIGADDWKTLSVKPANDCLRLHDIELVCEGPYFILDPQRVKKERDNDGPDMLALMRDEKTPVFLGKQITQELRHRSAWLESHDWLENNGYDYAEQPGRDDMNRHLRADDDPADLTRTERLFGVAGWGKRVRVISVAVDWPDKREYRGEGIKLDVFTQAPIDGALIEYRVPAGLKVKVKVRLALDTTGLQPGDEEHFKRVLYDLKSAARRPRFGHATGGGFGAFTVNTPATAAGETP